LQLRAIGVQKKIKVLHIVPALTPGGAERMVVHITRGLDRSRFEVAVVSIWRQVGSDLERLLDDSDADVFHLGKGRGFDCRMYPRLHRALGEYQPDIVHTHLDVLRYAFTCSVWFKRTSRWLHTVNNIAECEVGPRARWIQRLAFASGVLPVAVSEEVATSVRRLYGIDRCQVIWNCIPTDLYGSPRVPRAEWRAQEGFADDDLLIACVARFHPQKNHALLLDAFAQGPARHRKAHLVLVGGGPLRRELEERAQKLGVVSQVHFLGVRADIPEVLAAMDVFALSSDYEGSPLSVVEAMAAGLPVVSTRAGGVAELVEDGREGLLVQPGDVNSLSRAMTFLAEDTEARRSMGMAGSRRARDSFDVSAMIQAYEALYETLYRDLRNRRADVVRESAVPV
jgi:glycosyltransferase involved in cell wall biosynthesis